MEPALPLDDSEEEGCAYLKQVQTESLLYSSRKIKLGESKGCEDLFIPRSRIPSGYSIPLSDSQKLKILEKFSNFRLEIRQHLSPKETKRQKKQIQKTLYESKPLIDTIKELDQLTIWKIFEYLEEWIEDYLVLEEWIYCMLVLLDTPLSLDIYSILNTIMIKAIELSPRPSSLVIITIISEFFGQKLY